MIAPTAVKSSRAPAGDFQKDLVALIPYLRAFSRTLCGQRALAEDMAQEALAKAWRSRERFEPGTNLKAWLFTILRNEFYSSKRRAWRNVAWDEELGNKVPTLSNVQGWKTELSDTARALAGLNDDQREALLLVAVGGFSYEEAAGICGTAVGTVKSRVARGRAALLEALDGDKPLQSHQPAQDIGAFDSILAQLSAAMPVEPAHNLPA